MINTDIKKANKYNSKIIPLYCCVILTTVLQKYPIILGFICNKYTAKLEQATQLMNLLVKFNFVNANTRIKLAKMTIGLTYV